MSRIGKMPVAIPTGVTVTVTEDNVVTVKGKLGTLERKFENCGYSSAGQSATLTS